ncbi:ABC transporter ATP-binding protein [Candidatus Dojkabacteria bacterium]|nr:ABC transporter ATP-binding protein [Candidatus Dojkabacteria bacterium]
MKSEKIIEVKNLFKRYGNLVAVNDISFDVYKGEIFGLLGPNGAGKTTTLEIMETLRDETDGDVTIAGYSINKDPNKIKRLIGIQLQQSGFYPKLNLTQLIQLFEGLYGVKVDTKEVLDSVGLGDKAKVEFSKMSGGQKQRFSLAVTLINRPRIIFLDEPTTGLDPQTRVNIWDLIRSIRDTGVTIIMTTHYMEEAEELCDRVGIMDNGKLVAIDTPQNLVQELLDRGFKSKKVIKPASLADVFLDLTGKELRE